MEGSPHKHKRTIAQDFLTKSLSQSIQLNLSLNRYSFTTDHSGPLTLRVTHHSGPEDSSQGDKMKKSSIQGGSNNRTISNLKTNLLQLQQKLSQAHRQLNSSQIPQASPISTPPQRSTVGSHPYEFQKMLGLFVCNEVSEDESTINLESQKLLAIKSRDKLQLTHAHQLSKYYTGHLLKALMGSKPQAIQHLNNCIASMKKAMIIRMPSQIEIQNKKMSLSLPPNNRKTLLLQLQETLLVRRGEREEESDVQIGSGNSKFYVSLRPYLFSFLKKLKQYFELVIFTTIQKPIARQILEEIDPQSKLISDCLTKEHCLTLKGDIICKDIRIINRNVKDICMIDAVPDGALLHPDNYIPILPYLGGQGEDRQLMQLEKYLLKEIMPIKDVREGIRERFKLNRYWQYEHWDSLVKELYVD